MPTRHYMYLDEAGNFDFSPSGSKYFIMTCVFTHEPFTHVEPLYNAKCDCLANGIGLEKCKDGHRFHATEDPQSVRDAVFGIIKENLGSFAVYSVVIRKNMTNPAIRDFQKLYMKVFGWLVGYIFSHEIIEQDDNIVIVTDHLPMQKKQAAVKASLKKLLNIRAARMGISYRLYHHKSSSDINLQVADYCCWAIQRKWERDDARSYDYIKDVIRGEGDLFREGDTVYYRFEN